MGSVTGSLGSSAPAGQDEEPGQRRRPRVSIGFTVKSKGLRGMVRRAGLIARRFGRTPARMDQYLRQCLEVAREFDTTWTLPITAMPITRSPEVIRRYAEEGLNFAVHGLVHDDHAVASYLEQLESIKRAKDIFDRHGIPLSGFRGPYLRHNAATLEALRTLGFQFHTSQAVNFSGALESEFTQRQRDAYDRATTLYSALDSNMTAVRPRDIGRLIDIPIAIPDDEIMVDRFNFSSDEQTATWMAILEETHRRGEIFTLQLHPERIFECLSALRTVLTAARGCRPDVWMAPLEEIADWWNERCLARLTVTQTGDSRYHVSLTGSADATLLVRGLPGIDSEPWHGPDRRTRDRDFEVSSPTKPLVGVSTRSSEQLQAFLHEEGFPYELSNDRSLYGAYVDADDESFNEAQVLETIDRSTEPLVRLWRWPRGARSALALTGDIDSITIQDFAIRLWETRK